MYFREKKRKENYYYQKFIIYNMAYRYVRLTKLVNVRLTYLY